MLRSYRGELRDEIGYIPSFKPRLFFDVEVYLKQGTKNGKSAQAYDRTGQRKNCIIID